MSRFPQRAPEREITAVRELSRFGANDLANSGAVVRRAKARRTSPPEVCAAAATQRIRPTGASGPQGHPADSGTLLKPGDPAPSDLGCSLSVGMCCNREGGAVAERAHLSVNLADKPLDQPVHLFRLMGTCVPVLRGGDSRKQIRGSSAFSGETRFVISIRPRGRRYAFPLTPQKSPQIRPSTYR